MQFKSLGTHDGTFHADEVTAAGLLIVFDLVKKELIVRTRDTKLLEQCEYVCDVGGVYDPGLKRFDHHQVDYKGDLSSAGMILKYLFSQKIVSEREYEFFNRSLILGVDAHDNGRATFEPGVCTFSQVITNFVPPDYESPPEMVNKAFFEAVTFAEGHLRRLVNRYRYMESCREVVERAMKPRQKYLMFDHALAWVDLFFDMGGEAHPALFVVMPSGDHWKLRAIPPNGKDRMKMRQPLPESWAGLMDVDLKKASGISGAIFCHKGRFISVWETKDDVIKALNQVLKI